jgi:hypothetical protein
MTSACCQAVFTPVTDSTSKPSCSAAVTRARPHGVQSTMAHAHAPSTSASRLPCCQAQLCIAKCKLLRHRIRAVRMRDMPSSRAAAAALPRNCCCPVVTHAHGIRTWIGCLLYHGAQSTDCTWRAASAAFSAARSATLCGSCAVTAGLAAATLPVTSALIVNVSCFRASACLTTSSRATSTV